MVRFPEELCFIEQYYELLEDADTEELDAHPTELRLEAVTRSIEANDDKLELWEKMNVLWKEDERAVR